MRISPEKKLSQINPSPYMKTFPHSFFRGTTKFSLLDVLTLVIIFMTQSEPIKRKSVIKVPASFNVSCIPPLKCQNLSSMETITLATINQVFCSFQARMLKNDEQNNVCNCTNCTMYVQCMYIVLYIVHVFYPDVHYTIYTLNIILIMVVYGVQCTLYQP